MSKMRTRCCDAGFLLLFFFGLLLISMLQRAAATLTFFSSKGANVTLTCVPLFRGMGPQYPYFVDNLPVAGFLEANECHPQSDAMRTKYQNKIVFAYEPKLLHSVMTDTLKNDCGIGFKLSSDWRKRIDFYETLHPAAVFSFEVHGQTEGFEYTMEFGFNKSYKTLWLECSQPRTTRDFLSLIQNVSHVSGHVDKNQWFEAHNNLLGKVAFLGTIPACYILVASLALYWLLTIARSHEDIPRDKCFVMVLMLSVEFVTGFANGISEIFIGTFVYGIRPNFGIIKFFAAKFMFCGLLTTLLCGLYWRDTRKRFIKQVSSFRIISEKYSFVASHSRLLVVLGMGAVILDVGVGFAVLYEVPNFELVATGTGTVVSLFVGIIYVIESISFGKLLTNLRKSSGYGVTQQKGFLRMKHVHRVFLAGAVMLLLNCAVILSNMFLGNAFYTVFWWHVWWFFFHATRIPASFFQICVVIPSKQTKISAVTIRRKTVESSILTTQANFSGTEEIECASA